MCMLLVFLCCLIPPVTENGFITECHKLGLVWPGANFFSAYITSIFIYRICYSNFHAVSSFFLESGNSKVNAGLNPSVVLGL